MGYFDYLDQANVQEKKDLEFFDAYARWSFWIGIAGLALMLISFVLLVIFGFGNIIWLDIAIICSLVVVIVSLYFAIKTIYIAKKRDKSTPPLALMCLAWGIFFVMCNVIFLLINTLVYFG